MPEKKELTIVGLASSESQPGNYVLVLEDLYQQRRIPIIIGMPEAQLIAIAMEQMQPARPLTHDLMKNVIETLGGTLKEVVIHQFTDNVFHAHLVLERPDGTIVETDARTSDAIALAIRCLVPIYSFDKVIVDVGILSGSLIEHPPGASLAEYSLAELEVRLESVVAKEDYESASEIRDYIKKKKNEA